MKSIEYLQEQIWKIEEFFDWFLYFRKGKIKYKVWPSRNGFYATASDGKITVAAYYGSTRESAKEMALFHLKQSYEEKKEKEEKEPIVILTEDGFYKINEKIAPLD